MSRLYFECNFKSDELRSLDLPVEVRKPNFVSVTRSLSSRSVEVKPGIYDITVKLPAGQELYTRIQVVEGTDAKVVLTPEPEDVPLHEWQEVDLYLGGQLPTTASQDSSSEPLAPGQVKARLRAFVGNVLKSNYKAIDVSDWKRSVRKLNGVARLGISGRDRTQLVQLLQPQKPPVNMFLPAWNLSECFVVFTQLPKRLFIK